jgi:hypothetical protein
LISQNEENYEKYEELIFLITAVSVHADTISELSATFGLRGSLQMPSK